MIGEVSEPWGVFMRCLWVRIPILTFGIFVRIGILTHRPLVRASH